MRCPDQEDGHEGNYYGQVVETAQSWESTKCLKNLIALKSPQELSTPLLGVALPRSGSPLWAPEVTGVAGERRDVPYIDCNGNPLNDV
jgi:hypothetical protein